MTGRDEDELRRADEVVEAGLAMVREGKVMRQRVLSRVRMRRLRDRGGVVVSAPTSDDGDLDRYGLR